MKNLLGVVVTAAMVAGTVGLSFSGDKFEQAIERWPAGEASPGARLKAGAEVFQLVFSLYLRGKEMGGKIIAIPRHRLQLGIPSKGTGTSRSTTARIFAPILPEDAVAVVDYFTNENLLSGAMDLSKAPFTMDEVQTPTTYGFVLTADKNTRFMVLAGTAPQAVKRLEDIRAMFEKRGSSNVVNAINVALEFVAKDDAATSGTVPQQ